MFESKTVFVVGAGASYEVGLPIGSQLKDKIANKVDFSFDFGDQKSGDSAIIYALREYIRQNNDAGLDINNFVKAGRMISGAMPQASSIDNYIDSHRNDYMIQLCGKLAIVKCILEAEARSRLCFEWKRNDSYISMIKNVDGTWYSEFWKMLSDKATIDEFESSLENVSFIIFNYDRCIEHYLYYAILNYYGITEDHARELVRKITIFHPYGQVGALAAENSRSQGQGNPFGEQKDGLISVALQIKTFSERVEEERALRAMRQEVQQADTLVFLGFAYHPQNLELISPEQPSKVRRVFGTTYGFSEPDCNTIRTDTQKLLKHIQADVQLKNCKCAELFTEYARSLPRAI